MNRINRIRWQAELARCAGQRERSDCELVSEIELGATIFGEIRDAVREYVTACFEYGSHGSPSSTLDDRLNADLDALANRTPNGALVPKREFQSEFNRIHQSVAAWVQSLGIVSIVDSIFCPLTVRVVSGQSSRQADDRPYASSKLHVDLWAGDPADTVAVIIPVLGDIERTTIEWFRPPDGLEENYLRVFDSYDFAQVFEDQCAQYPIQARMGCAYFVDAVVLHRTVRNGGGTRVNIQFPIRRRLSSADRQRVENACRRERLPMYVSPDDWFRYGSEKFLRFMDSNADAARGIFRPHQDHEKTFEVVDHIA